MELIAAILLAGPLGYFCHTRKKGLGLYLLAFAVIFPIQTAAVHSDNADDIGASYFVINAAILALGIGLNIFGARLRQRRRRATSEANS